MVNGRVVVPVGMPMGRSTSIVPRRVGVTTVQVAAGVRVTAVCIAHTVRVMESDVMSGGAVSVAAPVAAQAGQ